MEFDPRFNQMMTERSEERRNTKSMIVRVRRGRRRRKTRRRRKARKRRTRDKWRWPQLEVFCPHIKFTCGLLLRILCKLIIN